MGDAALSHRIRGLRSEPSNFGDTLFKEFGFQHPGQ